MAGGKTLLPVKKNGCHELVNYLASYIIRRFYNLEYIAW